MIFIPNNELQQRELPDVHQQVFPHITLRVLAYLPFLRKRTAPCFK
jgi:hypothetical protein